MSIRKMQTTTAWALHCYLSRVENGHTVPVLETREKLVTTAGRGLPFVPNLLQSIKGEVQKKTHD